MIGIHSCAVKRKYELKKRAERQAGTRQRIVEAAVALHSTVGPAETSVAAVARRAGVQRHTVYAHFPDDAALFGACSAHWGELHPFPDVSGLELAPALEAVYGWYDDVETSYALFARDSARYPEIWERRQQLLATLADRLAARVARRKLVRAAVGHALAFETWRSLVRGQGLSNGEAAAAMGAFVRGV
jgi:AcrR family transcriptional regulator